MTLAYTIGSVSHFGRSLVLIGETSVHKSHRRYGESVAIGRREEKAAVDRVPWEGGFCEDRSAGSAEALGEAGALVEVEVWEPESWRGRSTME